MALLSVELPHSLSRAEARQWSVRLLTSLENNRKVSDFKSAWKQRSCSFSLTVSGWPVKGTIKIRANKIIIIGTLPFAVGEKNTKQIRKLFAELGREVFQQRAS